MHKKILYFFLLLTLKISSGPKTLKKICLTTIAKEIETIISAETNFKDSNQKTNELLSLLPEELIIKLQNKFLKIFSKELFKPVEILNNKEDIKFGPIFNPQKNTLFSISQKTKLYNISSKKTKHAQPNIKKFSRDGIELYHHSNGSYTPNGKSLIWGTDEGTIEIDKEKIIQVANSPINHLLSISNHKMIFATNDYINYYNYNKKIFYKKQTYKKITKISHDPLSKNIAIGFEDGTVKIFKKDLTALCEFKAHNSKIINMHFINSNLLTSNENTIKNWKITKKINLFSGQFINKKKMEKKIQNINIYSEKSILIVSHEKIKGLSILNFNSLKNIFFLEAPLLMPSATISYDGNYIAFNNDKKTFIARLPLTLNFKEITFIIFLNQLIKTTQDQKKLEQELNNLEKEYDTLDPILCSYLKILHSKAAFNNKNFLLKPFSKFIDKINFDFFS